MRLRPKTWRFCTSEINSFAIIFKPYSCVHLIVFKIHFLESDSTWSVVMPPCQSLALPLLMSAALCLGRCRALFSFLHGWSMFPSSCDVQWSISVTFNPKARAGFGPCMRTPMFLLVRAALHIRRDPESPMMTQGLSVECLKPLCVLRKMKAGSYPIVHIHSQDGQS